MSTNIRRMKTDRVAVRPAHRALRPARSAFTLVEMLVVITIISILAALGAVAVFKALETAKKARIKAEVTNLDSALAKMKTDLGDYPPSDFISGDLANDPSHPVRRFITKAFARCEEPASTWSALAGLKLTPAQAMCFWLRGFTKDPKLPITGAGDRTPFFDFDASRLYKPDDTPYAPGGPIPVYKPVGSKVPYVYFNAKSYYYHHTTPTPFTYAPVTGSGVCLPYMWDRNGDGVIDDKDYDTSGTPNGKLDDKEIPDLYANPKSFQIISAGPDGDYGTPPSLTPLSLPRPSGSPLTISKYKVYPTGIGYDTSGAEDDNIANFSKGTTIGDDKP